jgi:hypothetical protein
MALSNAAGVSNYGGSGTAPTATQNVMVQRVVEGGDLQTVESDDVTMGVWHAPDESVQAQPALQHPVPVELAARI